MHYSEKLLCWQYFVDDNGKDQLQCCSKCTIVFVSMQNALILHGTYGNSHQNWFPWVKNELEQAGWKVWVPDLPGADFPNSRRYNMYILGNRKWSFNKDSIIIGHSSGAVAALGLLQNLPEKSVVNKVILVGSFRDNLGWHNLDGLFEEPLRFAKLKRHAKEFLFIHSDNDPYGPLDHAQYLAKKLDAKLLVQKGEQHFSIKEGGEKYKRFPYLLQLLKENYSLWQNE